MNLASEADRKIFKPATGLRHPCAKQFSKLRSDELDNDYAALINSVQRHKKYTSYCLRKINGQKSCKFGFHQNICTSTSIEFQEHKDGHYSVILNTKCNDEIMNKHNRLQIQTWRANCDMQLILDWRACLGYIAKCAAKAEQQSKHINSILAKRY